jgi:Protein of unknown function (DUF2917)
MTCAAAEIARRRLRHEPAAPASDGLGLFNSIRPGVAVKSDLDRVLEPMRRHELKRIDDGQARTLVLSSGVIWLTQDGDREDHVLAAGESFAFEPGRAAVVQALTDSSLLIVGQRDSGEGPRAWPMTALELHAQARQLRNEQWHRVADAAFALLRKLWARARSLARAR